MCVYMFMRYVHMFECVNVDVCVLLRVQWSHDILNIGPCPLLFLKQGLLFASLYARLHGPTSSQWLCLQSSCRNAGVIDVHYHGWFYLGVGIWTEVLTLVWKVLYPLLPIPLNKQTNNLFMKRQFFRAQLKSEATWLHDGLWKLG